MIDDPSLSSRRRQSRSILVESGALKYGVRLAHNLSSLVDVCIFPLETPQWQTNDHLVHSASLRG
jgi:hypothetical protein